MTNVTINKVDLQYLKTNKQTNKKSSSDASSGIAEKTVLLLIENILKTTFM